MLERWNDLSSRERLLIVGAGVVLAALALFQFAWVPANAYREDAERALARSRAAYESVAASVAQAEAVQGRAAARADMPVRTALTTSAGRRNVSITRIGAEQGGVIELLVADAQAPDLFRWIADLEREYGIVVQRATLRTNDGEGTVNAQLAFSTGEGA